MLGRLIHFGHLLDGHSRVFEWRSPALLPQPDAIDPLPQTGAAATAAQTSCNTQITNTDDRFATQSLPDSGFGANEALLLLLVLL